VTPAPTPAAIPVAAVAAPAAPTEASATAPAKTTGDLQVVAKAEPTVQDVAAPAKTLHAAVVEPAAPLAKVATTEAPGHGDAPVAAAAPVAATAETEAAPVVEDFDSLLARCRDATTRGRWGAARTACNAAQQARPDSPDVLTRLAEIALNRGQGRAAMRLASAALAADPAFADAYVIVGSVEQGANRNQEARAAYNRYLKLAPSGRYASDLRAILATL
jgi:tetratricopeptide (TPR) repeat protein